MPSSYTILVEELDELNGEYPLPTDLTNAEIRTVKLMSGVRAGEIEEAAEAGDNDVMLAFAAIALKRAGKTFTEDLLWSAKGGLIRFKEHADTASDASPPAEPPSNAQDDSNGTSGPSSNGSGEPSPETSNRSGSGIQDSAIGVTSDQETSVTLRQVS